MEGSSRCLPRQNGVRLVQSQKSEEFRRPSPVQGKHPAENKKINKSNNHLLLPQAAKNRSGKVESHSVLSDSNPSKGQEQHPLSPSLRGSCATNTLEPIAESQHNSEKDHSIRPGTFYGKELRQSTEECCEALSE